jgi:mono/diheme cytochrome c family protein
MKRIPARVAVGLLLLSCLWALLTGPAALGKGHEGHEAQEALQHAPTDSASIAAGAKPFAKYCVPCHGASGHGDGPAGVALKPRPRDFTSAKNLKAENDGELFEVIKNGGASEKLSPMMPAWGGTLNKTQIWQVVAYIRGFPARDSLEKAHAKKPGNKS